MQLPAMRPEHGALYSYGERMPGLCGCQRGEAKAEGVLRVGFVLCTRPQNEMISMLSSRCMSFDWSVCHLLAIFTPKMAVGASRIRAIQGPVERLVGKSYDFGSLTGNLTFGSRRLRRRVVS
jgi:hypothetical protein